MRDHVCACAKILHDQLVRASFATGPSIHTIPDESDTLRIAFAESNHSAVKVVCIGLLSISDHF